MKEIIVEGRNPLKGEIAVSGAKNAVLPLMAATLLCEGVCVIDDAPRLADVSTMCRVIEGLGADCDFHSGTLEIDTSGICSVQAPEEPVRQMRASFLVMGPLLAKYGMARISLPGGCAIGARPIDLHLKGLEALGAKITIEDDYIEAKAKQLLGTRIYLDFPSVGATENLMMAAVLAQGNTVIENAAAEPEIVDLANLLGAMGAKIKGAGTKVIRIAGVASLHPARHTVIPDRVEAGSFMLAAAATGGDLLVTNVIPEHLKPISAKLQEAGVKVKESYDWIRVKSNGMAQAVDIKTLPYPGFPTDLQAQFMAFLATAGGTSIVTETVFENRFMHVRELAKMGAKIEIDKHSAIVHGVPRLHGASVRATDLRAGAAMIIAGLMAEGKTTISDVFHIERGYENICQKLAGAGAKIVMKGKPW